MRRSWFGRLIAAIQRLRPRSLSPNERLMLVMLGTDVETTPMKMMHASGGYLCLRLTLLTVDRLVSQGLAQIKAGAATPGDRVYHLTETGRAVAQRLVA